MKRRSAAGKRFSLFAALVTLTLAFAVLIAWALGAAQFPRFFEGFPQMVPNTALGLGLGSVVLLILRKQPVSKRGDLIATGISIGVIGIAIAALTEDVTERSLAVNRLLLEVLGAGDLRLEGGQSPAPAPNTAVAFLLLSLSFHLFRKRLVASQVSAILAFSVAALALVGQAYRIAPLYHPAGYARISGMALPTALGFLLLSAGVIGLRLEEGLLRYYQRESSSRELLRRFVGAMILAPLLFGVGAVLGAGRSVDELLFVLTGVALLLLAGFTAVVWSSVLAMDRLERTRAEAEDRLKRQERLLTEAQRVAKLGSWEWSLPDNSLHWSEEVYRLFGLSAEGAPLNYEKFLSYVHPQDRELVDEEVKKALAGRAFYSIDHRVIRPDGEMLYVHEQAEVSFSADGRPLRMIGTVYDITERKRIEKSLQEKEKLLSKVIDVLPVGLWLMNRDGRIYRGNEAGKRIWGGAKYVGLESFGVYRGWWEETGKEITREEWAAYRAIQFGETSIGELVRIQCFDGSQKVVLNSAVPIRDDQGAIQGAIIVNEEITERKRLEDQQRFLSLVSQELAGSMDFETTLSKAAEISVPELADWCLVHVLDSGKIPRLRALRHADPAQEVILRKGLESYSMDPETSPILNVIRSGKSLVVPSLSKEGIERIWLGEEMRRAMFQLKLRSFIIAPLTARGEVLGTLALVQGTSEREFSDLDRPLVEDLAQRIALALDNSRLYSEAVRAVKDREDVLSVVSHDLKNPLAAIQLSIQLLRRKLEPREDLASLARMVSTMRTAADAMNALIGNILDIGKIQAGTFAIEPKATSFGRLLQSVKDLFLPLASQKGISLFFEPDQLDFELICDPGRVVQVFSNLIGNAIKFTPAGGRVTVRLQHVNSELRICVEDNGPGISPSQLPHVFDRYWQARETATMGSGLGLFISKGIVAAHGGRIWAESQVGRGTRIHFALPEVPPGFGVQKVG